MKSVLVTGDSRGVGLETVKHILNKTSYKVVGISRTHSDECKRLEAEYKERYIHLNYDMADTNGLKIFFISELKKYAPFVGLVNNAAIAYDDIITNLNVEPLQKMFQVNVFSAMALTKLVIRDMLLHKTAGTLIHISSVSAHTGYKGLSMYAATKGAMEAFSKNAAREWGSVNIRSNCVCPGFMETEMSATLTEDQKNRIYQRTSLKKATDISSVASMVVFLLSPEASSITGQVINVDNGTT